MFGRGGRMDVFQSCCEVTGFSTEHHVKQGHLVHSMVMEGTISSCGDENVDEIKSLPANQKIDRADQFFVGELLETFHAGTPNKLVTAVRIDPILL
jgi:hypothetical protein